MDAVRRCIRDRRSIRRYLDKSIKREEVLELLAAAGWAPSGNNIQPWKFFVVMDDKELRNNLASLTVYGKWVKTAACLMLVYLDKDKTDDKIFKCDFKHKQAVGAAIQNLLLAAHEKGIGTCWIGEILKNEKKVNELAGVKGNLELMALITAGYMKTSKNPGKRQNVDDLIIGWK